MAELRRLAQRFATAADDLDRAARVLTQSVMTTTQWHGRDAEGFRGEWGSGHRVSVVNVAGSLRSAAAALNRNADEQEKTSTAHGGGGAHPWWIGDLASPLGHDGRDGLSETSQRAADSLYDLVRGGMKTASTLTDLRDLLDAIPRNEFGSLGAYLSDVKHLDGVAVLSALGLGLDAVDVAQAIGAGDEPATIQESLEFAAGVAGIWIPGASVAWDVGTVLGTSAWHAVDAHVDLDEHGYAAGVHALFGPDVSPEDLTPEQAAAVVQRYEGAGGVFVALGDTVDGQVDRGFARGLEAVGASSADDLTPAQAEALTKRYEGPAGFFNYVRDVWSF